MTGKQKRAETGWPWYGKIIVSVLVFFGVLLFAFLFVTSMSQNPDPRGQYYLDYQNKGVTLLVDWEAGATCWIVADVGVSCLPLNDLNRPRLFFMVYGIPVMATPGADTVPYPWQQQGQKLVTPEGVR